MALVKLLLAIDMVAMVKLLLGTPMVEENLSLAMAMSTMEKVLLAIVMSAMEAKVLLGVAVAATPVTHLLPLEVRATKDVARCTDSLSVRTCSSPHPRRREAILVIVTGSWRRRRR
jgi:hypothetical protein